MLSVSEIMSLNEMMIGRGVPDERDDMGYNKPDYARMYVIGMLNTAYTTEEAYLVLKTLQKYKNTQLTDYADSLEETLSEYDKKMKELYADDYDRSRAEAEAKNGVKHSYEDYEPETLLYYGENNRNFLFGFKEFIDTLNPKTIGGGWTRTDNGDFCISVPSKNLKEFLDKVRYVGKVGYVLSNELEKHIEAKIQEWEKEDSATDIKFVLRDLEKTNPYGHTLFEVSPNTLTMRNTLWLQKNKCLSYIDGKDPSRMIVSVKPEHTEAFISYCRNMEFDCSQPLSKQNTKKEEENNKNKSGNKLIDVTKLDLPFTPYQFQLDDAAELLSKKKALAGHDMGCVSGKSKVRIKEQGKTATREVYIDNLAKLFKKDNTIQIKSLVNGRFAFMPIKAVIDKGMQYTIRINTQHYTLECTKDHKIYTPNGWIEAEKLSIGDDIYCNGDRTCLLCGTKDNLIKHISSKYYGYCKACSYLLRPNGNKGIVKKIDKNGYVRLIGNGTKNMPSYKKMTCQGGIYEHHQVWYENTGHIVDTSKEIIHHKNGIKTDNRFENLELMLINDHKKHHSTQNSYSLPEFNNNIEYLEKKGKKVYYVPKTEKIISIEEVGVQRVWDIAIDDAQIHNFVCNGVVVHNCGKTFISTLVGMSIDTPKLVVCPESLRLNWKRELERTDKGSDISVVYSKDKDVLFGADWTIMGYQTATKFMPEIVSKGIQCMFIDEAHNCKSVNSYGEPSSKRAKALVTLAKHMKYTYLLTGTPMPTRNKDLYNMFVMLGEIDPDARYAFHNFGKKYCDAYNTGYGWDYNGSSNTAELHDILNKYMTRRLKSEVLPHLKKQRQFIPLEETSREYKDIEKRLYNMNDGDTYMGLAMTGRKVLSKVKIKPTIDLAETFLNADESVVIVTEFNETMDELLSTFGDNACFIRGGMSDEAKQKAVEDFQAGRKKVCVLNTIAGGTGHTLTNAHNMIICDYDWTPANMTQVEDRICRTGQTAECCNIYYMYCENALLDRIFVDMITGKSANIDKVVDAAENTVDLTGAKDSNSSYLDVLKEELAKGLPEKEAKKTKQKSKTKTKET